MMLTPHGPGFSFLDTLAVVEPGKRARGTKWLDPKSAFFADHFPGNPLMPGVLLAVRPSGNVTAEGSSRPRS